MPDYADNGAKILKIRSNRRQNSGYFGFFEEKRGRDRPKRKFQNYAESGAKSIRNRIYAENGAKIHTAKITQKTVPFYRSQLICIYPKTAGEMPYQAFHRVLI